MARLDSVAPGFDREAQSQGQGFDYESAGLDEAGFSAPILCRQALDLSSVALS